MKLITNLLIPEVLATGTEPLRAETIHYTFRKPNPQLTSERVRELRIQLREQWQRIIGRAFLSLDGHSA
jgi:hypothetical protein